jgi:hypothetical protein
VCERRVKSRVFLGQVASHRFAPQEAQIGVVMQSQAHNLIRHLHQDWMFREVAKGERT